mgnify:CR=1 FL=1
MRLTRKKNRAECHQKPDSSLIAEEAEKFQDVVLGERGVGKTYLSFNVYGVGACVYGKNMILVSAQVPFVLGFGLRVLGLCNIYPPLKS